jgi:hypothetical protein
LLKRNYHHREKSVSMLAVVVGVVEVVVEVVGEVVPNQLCYPP